MNNDWPWDEILTHKALWKFQTAYKRAFGRDISFFDARELCKALITAYRWPRVIRLPASKLRIAIDRLREAERKAAKPGDRSAETPQQFLARFSRCYRTHDADKVLNFFRPDAVVAGPDGRFEGRPRIRGLFGRRFEMGADERLAFDDVEIVAEKPGLIGVMFTWRRSRMRARRTHTQRGRGVAILNREDDALAFRHIELFSDGRPVRVAKVEAD